MYHYFFVLIQAVFLSISIALIGLFSLAWILFLSIKHEFSRTINVMIVTFHGSSMLLL